MEHYRKNYENMILRDYLALDRTKLANERTFLSYIRTFLSLLAIGFSLIEFADNVSYSYIGIIFCIISPVFLIVGVYRFYTLKKMIKTLEKNNIENLSGSGGES